MCAGRGPRCLSSSAKNSARRSSSSAPCMRKSQALTEGPLKARPAKCEASALDASGLDSKVCAPCSSFALRFARAEQSSCDFPPPASTAAAADGLTTSGGLMACPAVSSCCCCCCSTCRPCCKTWCRGTPCASPPSVRGPSSSPVSPWAFRGSVHFSPNISISKSLYSPSESLESKPSSSTGAMLDRELILSFETSLRKLIRPKLELKKN
mmetsp:Transcript_96879/g.260527  ORF Transcript_96879/g.260527 Transcript_96879/m.260527 type:complete len:210 (+) Transcript_96879:1305-1934(+)